MIHTGGNWNPADERILFCAGNTGIGVYTMRARDVVDGTDRQPLYEQSKIFTSRLSKLLSLLNIRGTSWRTLLENDLSYHEKIFLDSGIFGLASQHAAKHGITHNEALRTPVNQIDGWDEFLEFYVMVCSQYKDRLWGYVELDLGGREQKILTRQHLESRGLNPIPVWHPLSDGMDYGEYLFSNYDRVCVGNLVKTDEDLRKEVLRAMALVKHRHPDVWVHALGMAVVPWAASFPINSLDAMTWLGPLMYPKRATWALMHKFEEDEKRLYSDRDDYFMAHSVLQKQVWITQLNWRNFEAAKKGPHHERHSD